MVEVNTNAFGKIAIADDKIIRFEHGILGFPDLKDFTLIFTLRRVQSLALSGSSRWTNRTLQCR